MPLPIEKWSLNSSHDLLARETHRGSDHPVQLAILNPVETRNKPFRGDHSLTWICSGGSIVNEVISYRALNP